MMVLSRIKGADGASDTASICSQVADHIENKFIMSGPDYTLPSEQVAAQVSADSQITLGVAL
jgi:hypothetical protein